MFTKLVVPLDGSELAASALPYAISMAASAHAERLLVRVALAPAPMTVDDSNWERQQIEVVEEAETYLATVATTITPGVSVKTCVPYGRARRELLDAIRLSHAEGVVMATHGRTGIRHLLYGSVAEGLLAKSPVPVMLVHTRSGEAPPALFDSTSAHVAVPLNGSSLAETALDPAVDLVGSRGELILVCVVEPPTRVERDDTGHVIAHLDQQEEARAREARGYLSDVARKLEQQRAGLRLSADVRLGDPADGIIMATNDRGADLIVMATHGRTWADRCTSLWLAA